MPEALEECDRPSAQSVAPPSQWCESCRPEAYAEFRGKELEERLQRDWRPHESPRLRLVPKRAEPWETLPAALSHIRQRIEDSKDLLALVDDWDDDGAVRIAENTWRRAVEFLTRYARWIRDDYGKAIDAPDIAPGPDGSVDLHWDYPAYELLVNIPRRPKAMAGFYGDNRGGAFNKGSFDPASANEGLLLWLRGAI